jgi:hypothetical protein
VISHMLVDDIFNVRDLELCTLRDMSITVGYQDESKMIRRLLMPHKLRSFRPNNYEFNNQ